MGVDDARKLDHATLEAMRIRAVRSVQAGERPTVVARSLRVSDRTIYGWLAQYRRGGWGALKAKPLFVLHGQGRSRLELAIRTWPEPVLESMVRRTDWDGILAGRRPSITMPTTHQQ